MEEMVGAEPCNRPCNHNATDVYPIRMQDQIKRPNVGARHAIARLIQGAAWLVAVLL
jgi:hypothetical protein